MSEELDIEALARGVDTSREIPASPAEIAAMMRAFIDRFDRLTVDMEMDAVRRLVYQALRPYEVQLRETCAPDHPALELLDELAEEFDG